MTGAAATARFPSGRVLLAPFLAFASLMLLMLLGIATMSGEDTGDIRQPSYVPSATAVADIPNDYLVTYLSAGETHGLDWAILAAIGKVETDHGRLQAPGVTSGVNAHGCCSGPMQFSVVGSPSTWDSYGVDGNRDGKTSPFDPEDAIPAAARYLKASGAPGDYRAAIFAYNHAGWYVADVLSKAAQYRGALRNAASLPQSVIVNQHNAGDVLRLASGPGAPITLTALQRNDLASGQIDGRITSLLVASVSWGHEIAVSSLKSDHSYFTTGGSPSNHAFGRAVDIAIVDGERCDSNTHGRTGRCWLLGRRFASLTGALAPTELIYGIDLDGGGPAVARADHTDHLHAGYDL